MLPLPRLAGRVAAASALAVLAPLLAACGDDDAAAVTVGDVIPARSDDQFSDGARSMVALPTGKLLIRTGEPVTALGAEDTRERTAYDAPSGATFLPITWQYDRAAFERVQGYLSTRATPVIDLVVDGESYRLPTPDQVAQEGVSFYVAVEGEAADPSLQVEFDGVEQAVDLVGGRTEQGRAAALYDLDLSGLRPTDCPIDGWFDLEGAVAEYTCEVTGPVVLPFAGDAWAQPGRAFVGIELDTNLARYSVAEAIGSGAVYAATGTTLRVRLGGAEPATEIRVGGEGDACPNSETFQCGQEVRLIFDVPAGRLPTELQVRQAFRLALVQRMGSFDADKRIKVDADGSIDLEYGDERRKGADRDAGRQDRGRDQDRGDRGDRRDRRDRRD